MVFTPYFASFLVVARPTYRISEAGNGHTRSRQFWSSSTVMASGFFMSLPSFAKILLKETPTDTVMPSSVLTATRISSAMCSASRKLLQIGVMSIQHSSIPKDSTSLEYRR